MQTKQPGKGLSVYWKSIRKWAIAINKNTLVSTHPVLRPSAPMAALSAKAAFSFDFNLRAEAESGARFRPTVYGRKELVISIEAFKSQFKYLLYISINVFIM